MTPHPPACRLAISIIGDHYGEICRRVCSVLLERGTQSLRELVKAVGELLESQTEAVQDFPEVTAENSKERRREADRLLRSALLVLMQHNYVSAHLVSPAPTVRNAAPISYHVYIADLPRILQALRKPRVQLHVHEAYSGSGGGEDEAGGAVQEAVISALLENGRLRLEQIVPAAAEKLELPPEEAKRDIEAAFAQLLVDRYIERAVPCNLPPPPPPIFPKLKGSRRASAPKPGSEAAQKLEEEQAKQQPLKQYLDSRYNLPTELGIGPSSGKRTASGPASARPAKKPKRAGQRTADSTEVKPSCDSEALGDELWRISMTQFNRKFRYAAAVDFIRQWYGDECANLAEAVLAVGKADSSVEPSAERESPGATDAQVRQLVSHWAETRGEAFEALAEKDVGALLRKMTEDAPEILTLSSAMTGGRTYCVNLGAIIQRARQKQLEAAIRQRFGIHGQRLWQCLIADKQLEAKGLHERCLVPLKETRELLYHMVKAGFIAIQDIPRTTDHAPSKTFYTWKVDLRAAGEQMAAKLLTAAGNLRARLQHELKARAQALELVDKNDEAGMASNTSTLQQVKAIGMQLDSHMLRLDREIALFLDF